MHWKQAVNNVGLTRYQYIYSGVASQGPTENIPVNKGDLIPLRPNCLGFTHIGGHTVSLSVSI